MGENNRLSDQAQHLTQLINDLHLLAQAEAQQLPLNRRVCRPGRAARTAPSSPTNPLPLAARSGWEFRPPAVPVSCRGGRDAPAAR